MPKKNSLPPSREVRLADGVLIGDMEAVAFDIYTGDAGTLASSMMRLELVAERRQARALGSFALELKKQLAEDGYLVSRSIDDVLFNWHADEVLGVPHMQEVPQEQLSYEDEA